GESRKKVSDELYISPRYLANIENKGQQPSLQVFYDLVTRYHISVDQLFFPNSNAEKLLRARLLPMPLRARSLFPPAPHLRCRPARSPMCRKTISCSQARFARTWRSPPLMRPMTR
ncbi:helix-turn-helix domain-containing protein, partial [Ellagibacter isourolithinifaciens]|uniref:helix-turn-helix domain-containing protein n=1 Tax=Ellagibacter isourolithinifaciens TaxID=2137581 RepID=UPI003AACB188